MPHDKRLLPNEDKIAQLQANIPDWVKKLKRPPTPSLQQAFGPLSDIRVIGTGLHIAQPFAGTKLAQFGAEFIQLERPGGDPYRVASPQLARGPRSNGCGQAEIGKNRLSFGLDLKSAKGLELVMAMWKISDVWLESSMPGTIDRAGMSPELALAVNPALVILRVSTYGQYGRPDYLNRPGYDAIAQAYGGMMHVTGDPSGPPQRAMAFTGDYISGLTGWGAVMTALWEVKKTGRGQVLDLAQFESIAETQAHGMPLYTGEGVIMERGGNRAPGFQPYDAFKCHDGWVFIAAVAGQIYPRVPKFLGLDVNEYSFEACSKDAAAVNSEKGRELDRRLREYCSSHPALEVETALNEAKIGCVRIFSAEDQYKDEHYRLRDMLVPVLDRQSGVPIRVYGVVPKMSLTPGKVWRGSPAIGEDTTDILAKLLGLPDPEIKDLYAQKVVHRTEPFTEAQVAAIHP